jgi:O-antigen ligase
MGLSSAIDWWDEWKLRILVLCSLFVQFFLFFSEYVRQLYILRRLRFIVWLAYIGGDALAPGGLRAGHPLQPPEAAADSGGWRRWQQRFQR